MILVADFDRDKNQMVLYPRNHAIAILITAAWYFDIQKICNRSTWHCTCRCCTIHWLIEYLCEIARRYLRTSQLSVSQWESHPRFCASSRFTTIPSLSACVAKIKKFGFYLPKNHDFSNPDFFLANRLYTFRH